MKSLLISVFVFCFFSYASAQSEVVTQFHKLSSEAEEIRFIEKYKNNSSPDVKAYVYAVQMKQAEYSYNPYTKLDIFIRYKNLLDKAINENPNNVHLRYMRLVIQEKTPSLLGYKDQIEIDKTFLKVILNKKDSTDYLDKYILKYTSL